MGSHEKLLLIQRVDYLAKCEPERLLAVIPRGSEVSDGFQNMTMKDAAHAIDFMVSWLKRNVGLECQTLAYIGKNDFRYCIFMLACHKTGHRPFFPSRRNSIKIHLHLLKDANCSKLIHGQERKMLASEIQDHFPGLEIIPAPSTVDISYGESPSYPHDLSYSNVKDNPACIIHTSGTTGMPQLVILTHGFFAAASAWDELSWPENRQPTIFYNLKEPVLSTTPFFHILGLISFVISISYNTPVLYGPDKPLSVDSLINIIQTARPIAAAFPPSILKEMIVSEDGLKCLALLQSVHVGGAQLAPEVGNRLQEFTRVVSMIGSSEMGWIPSMVPKDSVNWNYFEWNPAYGTSMESVGDGLHELVINKQKNSPDLHGIFHTFPHLDSYRTKDLYSQHPDLPYLWKYYGRQDDVIVLNNGEKFNPSPAEKIIESHPLVASAVIVGHSKFQAGLLVEGAHANLDRNAFINEIWPVVYDANQILPTYAQIMKSMIGLAATPFKKTAKGTVSRKAVMQEHNDEVENLYTSDAGDITTIFLPAEVTLKTVTEYVRLVVARTLQKDDINTDQDLYSLGLDSLKAIQLSKALQTGTRLYHPGSITISSQTVFTNHTVKQLSEFIVHTLHDTGHTETRSWNHIESLVKKYTSDLPIGSISSFTRKEAPTTVILTGSTGSIGTYILHSLLHLPSIKKIYCLTLSKDARSRQYESFTEKGLCMSQEKWDNILEFIQVLLGIPKFGLQDQTKYQELLESVDTIIHSAWKVDFNMPLDSLEHPDIKGVRHMIDFSLDSVKNPHIHFFSSIASVGKWDVKGVSVPELPIEDPAVVPSQGYAESKHVAERTLLEACRKSGIWTTIYRIGQVAGPTTVIGKWNPHEWVPAIIKTSKTIGKVPLTLGSMVVDWVPVDTLASVIVEILLARYTMHSNHRCAFYHVTNPSKVEWPSLLGSMQELSLTHVDLKSWVAELEDIQDPTEVDLAEKPALKLMSFLRDLVQREDATTARVVLDVSRAVEASVTMREMSPITESLMLNWLRQWDF